MPKKTYTKRRYYRRYYRRYKNISMNYFRVKIEYNDRVHFSGENEQVEWNSRMAQQVPANRQLLTLAVIFNAYTYLNTLAGLFSYWKITGIRIEIIPEARNNAIPSNTDEKYVMISYRAGNNTLQTFNEVKANNQSITLDPINKISRYWRTYNATGAWLSTDTAFDGAFTVFANENSTYLTQPSYKVKINIYVIYKQSKA